MSERVVPVLLAAALLFSAPLSALADDDHHGGGRSHGKHYAKHHGKHGGKHYGQGYGYYAPAVYYAGPPPCARPRHVSGYDYYPAVAAVPVPVPVPHGSNVLVRVGVDWVLGY